MILRYFLLLICLALPLRAAEPTRVLLFGDSHMITTYLPKEDAVTAQLQRALEAQWPGQPVTVQNFARNGEWIARFLLKGGYQAAYTTAKGADIIFIRYGMNDYKRIPAEEYAKHLRAFLDRVQADFLQARIILETSIYFDPAHFSDNAKLNTTLHPYREAIRALAAERGLPVCDIYEASRVATEAGNWDLRIRRMKKNEPRVIDASQDAGRENDMRWFTDSHPNREGVRIAVAAEVALLKTLYPESLPTGGGKQARAAIAPAEFEAALQFPAARLEGKRSASDNDSQP